MARVGGKNAACASSSSIAAATTVRDRRCQARSRSGCGRPITRARIESHQLLFEPEHRLHWLRDPHGHRVAPVTFKAVQAVDVLVELAVEINVGIAP
jgi:hypothetical protein